MMFDEFVGAQISVAVTDRNIHEFLRLCQERCIPWNDGTSATGFCPSVSAGETLVIDCGYYTDGRITWRRYNDDKLRKFDRDIVFFNEFVSGAPETPMDMGALDALLLEG